MAIFGGFCLLYSILPPFYFLFQQTIKTAGAIFCFSLVDVDDVFLRPPACVLDCS